jgi:hypothetical protein
VSQASVLQLSARGLQPPTVAPEEAGRTALGRIVTKIFHGSAELTLARLVEDRRISRTELARMRRILDDLAEEDDR